MKRSKLEWVFVVFFVPAVVAFYAIYKYPHELLGPDADTRILGKSLSFWYMLLYTAIVCGIAGKALLGNKNVYSFKAVLPDGLSPYQKKKFTSIFLVQGLGFFAIPFVILPLMRGADFWNDPMSEPVKTAHVYLYPGFTSPGMAVYLFVVIPLFVWFFGKRYCSWICSCGNLAETVGITVWGKKWVKEGTPRGEAANRNHWIQKAVLFFAFAFGALLFFDSMKIVAAPDAVARVRQIQDFFIDFMFGSVIGIAAYPFWGTRIWCRYGCPLAKFMELSGKYTGSRFRVKADEKCTGIGLCSKACPMGIDVAAYAHKDRKPIMGSFGLHDTVCIGCGGCIDVCPTKALAFGPAGKPVVSAPAA
jgi:polyferredoxin